MHPDIHLVIKIQGLDNRISELEKEIAALPKHVAVIEKALDSHNRRLEADRAALSANQKERKKLEGDAQIQEQKISKLRDQTLQAKTNEQYRAFQHEIEYCQNEIRKAEDRILDLMGESEPLEANVKKAEVALKAEKTQVDAEKTRAHDRTAADRKGLEEARRERAELAGQTPASVLKLYEHARRKWHSAGIAEVQDSRCTECNMVLRPQHFQNLRMSTDVLICESCSRILYYNPPVRFETEMADRQVQ